MPGLGDIWLPDGARRGVPRQGLPLVREAVRAQPEMTGLAVQALRKREQELRRKARKLKRQREREARRRARAR